MSNLLTYVQVNDAMNLSVDAVIIECVNNYVIICKIFNIIVQFGNKVYNLKYKFRG